MKILVGNNRLRNPGGSETYTYALVAELVKRGHDVECVTSCCAGMTSEHVRKLGVPIHFESKLFGTYDLALLSHVTSIALARRVKAFKVQTCHGIYPTLEQPVEGMDNYVGISEEVVLHLWNQGYAPDLIRNGIDCNRFYPVEQIHTDIKTILSLSHSDLLNGILLRICDELGIHLIIQNKYSQPVWDVEHLINQADLVISLGRGAYESMACGRNVFIVDNRKYAKQGTIGDGMATKENVMRFAHNNCSGRFSKAKFSYGMIRDELSKYEKSNGEDLRQVALKEFNIEKSVDEYLKLVR